MKSSLKNMVLCLLGITLVCSAAVGYIYKITVEPIARAKADNIKAALSQVLPTFDQSTSQSVEIDAMPITVHTAAADGATVGYAVETMTKSGFSGEFRLMVGFNPDGTVYGIKVLEHSETPGLGSKMTDEGNPLLLSFQEKSPASMSLKVKKDGGDVDALTAATISSRAYVDAVARAYNALIQATGWEADAVSGATVQSVIKEEGGEDNE